MAGTPDLGASDAPDVINQLAGLSPESATAQLRLGRPEVARFAQGSYQALLESKDVAGVSQREREVVALRVAVLTPNESVAAWHRGRLHGLGVSDATIAAVDHFPEGTGLSARESAILRHTDLLVRDPGEATPEHIAALEAVGLGARDIVTIAQLIAFESFQVRVVAALRLFAEEK
jgi:CMD domain protein